MAVEEGQQQCSDMGSVDVGVGHDDDLMVAQFLQLKPVAADSASESGDHGADFLVLQDFVQPGFLHIEDFTADRQDRLETAVASHLGGAASGIPFDDVDLAERRIFLLAVGQLSREASAIERGFPQGQLAGLLAASRACAARIAFSPIILATAGCSSRKIVNSSPTICLDDRTDIAIAQALFRLPFELRIRHFDGDDGGQPFAHVFAGGLRFCRF